MAKRFTAAEKWDDPWFSKLSFKEKLFWIYLLDKCSHAGIWQVNWPLVQFHIPGYRFQAETFKGRILELAPDKWFIPKFIRFQYGELNPANRAHASVIHTLEKEGAYKDLISPLQGAKDKDKEKEVVDVVEVNVKGNTLARPEKKLHMDYVWLLPDEYEKLKAVIGSQAQAFIERLNGYIGQIGPPVAAKKYVSHYHTILNWYRKDKTEGKINGTDGGTGISHYAAIAKRARQSMGLREPPSAGSLLAGLRAMPTIPDDAESANGAREHRNGDALETVRVVRPEIKPPRPLVHSPVDELRDGELHGPDAD